MTMRIIKNSRRRVGGSEQSGTAPEAWSGLRSRWRPTVLGGAVCALFLAAAVLGRGGVASVAAQTSCATPIPPGQPPPPNSSNRVCYPPGWNLIGGPPFIRWPVPLFVWDPVAGQYKQFPADSQLQSAGIGNGQGAWASFQQTTAVDLGVQGGFASVPVSLAADQWQQAGSPYAGADTALCGSGFSAFTYDPTAGAYSQATVLTPGQGAWVYAPSGGTLTLKATDVPPPPSPCS